MRVAALVELSVDLLEAEARQLAIFGDLETALARLRDRIRVRRAIPGAEGDQRSQMRLAVYELSVEAKAGPEALRVIIKQGVEAEAAAVAAESQEAGYTKQAEKIFDESRASSAAKREFIRRADRLHTRQSNQLRISIFDSRALERAIAELNELYSHYIMDAISN